MGTIASVIWKVVEGIALAFFLIMVVLTMAQILFRDVLRVSVPWTEEATRWIFVWQVFIGSALAAKERIHLKITIIEERMSPRGAAVLDFAIRLVGILFLAGVFAGSLFMIKQERNVSAGSFSLSISYLYLSLPISAGLMALVYLRDLFGLARNLLTTRRKIQ